MTPETESTPVGLTEAEREALIEAIQDGEQDGWVARLIADRHAALLAEVAASRETRGRVAELATGWNDLPDYAPSTYDQGRVDQRHDMTMTLLEALDGSAGR